MIVRRPWRDKSVPIGRLPDRRRARLPGSLDRRFACRKSAPRVESRHVQKIVEVLQSIPGVRRAVQLSDEQRRRMVELEARHEQASAIPVRNLGVRLLADRHTCFALLKDSTFRPPRIPTVYLVEEDAPDGCANVLDRGRPPLRGGR